MGTWIKVKKLKALPVKKIDNGIYKIKLPGKNNDIISYFNIATNHLDSIITSSQNGFRAKIFNIELSAADSVLLDIGKDIMEVCPNALWLQYVNPMCSNMIAINKKIPQIKTLGLCHSVQGTAEMLAEDLGEDLQDIEYTCAGINHMAFFLKFEKIKDGNLIDLYPKPK